MHNKEQKFYNILQDLFVGAKLEGDSGYVNLMNIKTDYFNLIKKKIESEIKLKFGESKPEDLYDRLYTFFDSYFSDGGAIFFSSTPSYKNIYTKVYSDREDVSLFWKTSKLYYVKSEANYRTVENLQLNSDPEIALEFQFYFIGTQKRSGKKVIKFRVIYKNDNKYDKLKEILNIKDNTKIVKYILENSEKLNKKIAFKNDGLDLKILREQFDLYMYQQLAGSMETVFEQKDLDRIKKIKEVAYLAIDYIGNFEDELKKIWLKPKFARKSNYVVTLDRLADKNGGIKVIDKVIKNKGIKEQILEWQELNIVKKDFNQKQIVKDGKLNKDFQTLPIDTKHFKDLEIEIIGLFDNLDEALDGRLIKSDNFQALNTLLQKYKEQVQSIYIDPPFNTGKDFVFIDSFQDSTWLTLMDNRIELLSLYLKNEGNFYLHLDHIAEHYGKIILDKYFGSENLSKII